MSKLSHFDDAGEARMVDVSAKPATRREAEASVFVVLNAETLAALGHESAWVVHSLGLDELTVARPHARPRLQQAMRNAVLRYLIPVLTESKAGSRS